MNLEELMSKLGQRNRQILEKLDKIGTEVTEQKLFEKLWKDKDVKWQDKDIRNLRIRIDALNALGLVKTSRSTQARGWVISISRRGRWLLGHLTVDIDELMDTRPVSLGDTSMGSVVSDLEGLAIQTYQLTDEYEGILRQAIERDMLGALTALVEGSVGSLAGGNGLPEEFYNLKGKLKKMIADRFGLLD